MREPDAGRERRRVDEALATARPAARARRQRRGGRQRRRSAATGVATISTSRLRALRGPRSPRARPAARRPADSERSRACRASRVGCAASRAHSVTRIRGARCTASAVPHAPAPRAPRRQRTTSESVRARAKRAAQSPKTCAMRTKPVWPSRWRTLTQPGCRRVAGGRRRLGELEQHVLLGAKHDAAPIPRGWRGLGHGRAHHQHPLVGERLVGDPADRAAACRAPWSSPRRCTSTSSGTSRP